MSLLIVSNGKATDHPVRIEPRADLNQRASYSASRPPLARKEAGRIAASDMSRVSRSATASAHPAFTYDKILTMQSVATRLSASVVRIRLDSRHRYPRAEWSSGRAAAKHQRVFERAATDLRHFTPPVRFLQWCERHTVTRVGSVSSNSEPFPFTKSFGINRAHVCDLIQPRAFRLVRRLWRQEDINIMKILLVAAVAAGGLFAFTGQTFAQDAVQPGAGGSIAISPNGAGPDSLITGRSESGRGGTGGAGGQLSNGTSDGAGTATGGNSGGSTAAAGGGS